MSRHSNQSRNSRTPKSPSSNNYRFGASRLNNSKVMDNFAQGAMCSNAQLCQPKNRKNPNLTLNST